MEDDYSIYIIHGPICLDEECTPPEGLENGKVIGYVEDDYSWVGQYKCNVSTQLNICAF